MRVIKRILLAISLVTIVAAGFLAYIGYFSSVKPEEKAEGGYIIVGVNVTGSYSKVGQRINDVQNKLKEAGIKSIKGFGIYYDDPKITPSENCRSLVGSVISRNELAKVIALNLSDFKIDSIPRRNSVVAEFPIRNVLSYMIGPMKVYPAISKYMEEKNYTSALSFEIYDQAEKHIIFVMQIGSD